VHIKNGLIVDGSINFTGEWIRTDTNIQFTTQLDISNNGTGPAIIAKQTGSNDVASFMENSNYVLNVQQASVVVGRQTTTSGYMFDVAGNVNLDSKLNVGGNAVVVGDYSSTNGNITLTNGNLTVGSKIDTQTMEVHLDATFDADVKLVGAGNLDMTGTTGFLNQW
jgi:hypothetical protein